MDEDDGALSQDAIDSLLGGDIEAAFAAARVEPRDYSSVNNGVESKTKVLTEDEIEALLNPKSSESSPCRNE